MSETDQLRNTLQETMNFMSALAYGMEQLADRGANGTAYVAGKKLGKQFAADTPPTDDIQEAVAKVRDVLVANDCLWAFEPFQTREAPEVVKKLEDGAEQMSIVFRDCMIRQSLFRYGHTQKGSLCYMMYGFFAGALEAITGRKAELEIDHAGENACLKTLILRAKE